MDNQTTITAATYTGKGLYTIGDAARLVGLSTDRARRWVDGYRYKDRCGQSCKADALIARTFERVDNVVILSFVDLVELWFVSRFVKDGLSLQVIRKSVQKACERIGDAHPLSTLKFGHDYKRIYIDDGQLTILLSGQTAIAEVMKDYIHMFDFDADIDGQQRAHRWWPEGKKVPIVVDPERSFGTPILAGHGIPVSSICSRAWAGHPLADIAWAYDIPQSTVQHAINYGSRIWKH